MLDADDEDPMTTTLTPFRVMLYTAAVLVTLALGFLVLRIGSVLVIVALSIILASSIEPIVYRLRRHGFGRGQAILAIYAGLILTIAVGFYAILPSVVRQGAGLIDNIPTILNTLENQAEASDNEFIRETGAATIQRAQAVYRDWQQAPPIGGATAIQLATSTFGALFAFLSTLILAFYWLTEKAIIKRLLLGLLAPRFRNRAHGIWDSVEAKLGGWTRGQLILCFAIGLTSAIAYSPLFFDLPFWLALALWAGVTELIPFIGPWLGGSVATVVALTQSFEVAILVVIFVIVLQQFEGAWLVPRVMRNAVGLTPLTVIIAVQVGGVIGGIIGAVLAIPIAGAFQVIVQDLLATRKESLDFGDRRQRPTLLGSSIRPVPSTRPVDLLTTEERMRIAAANRSNPRVVSRKVSRRAPPTDATAAASRPEADDDRAGGWRHRPERDGRRAGGLPRPEPEPVE